MGKNRLKVMLVFAALVLSAWYVYPTLRLVMLSDETKAAIGEDAVDEIRSKSLNLGLDLQGGMHLVLEVDKSKLSDDEASDAVDRALQIIRNRVDQFGVTEPSIQREGEDRIIVQLPGVQDALQAKSLVGQTALLEFKVVRSSAEFTETLRRVDDFLYQKSEKTESSADDSEEAGNGDDEEDEASKDEESEDETEAEEEESGDDEAAPSETPGMDVEPETDPGDTAKPDFLADSDTPAETGDAKSPLTSRLRFFRTGEQDNAWVPLELIAEVESLLAVPGVRGLVPFGASFVWGRESEQYGEAKMRALYLLDDRAELTGSSVRNAVVQVGLDTNRPNTPGVSLTFTGEGSHDFSRITGANVGRRLAIVLDGKVQMAPTIIDKIPHGRASITGNFDFDESKILSIVLRAGALPARGALSRATRT